MKVFGLTNRPTIIQNHEKSRSKNRLVFGIDFGPLFLTFGIPKAPKSAPRSSQNAPKWVAIIGKTRSVDGPGLKMLQNGLRGSKSHHFGGQNDLPELKKRSQNDPRAQKTTPKCPESSKNDPNTTPELRNNTRAKKMSKTTPELKLDTLHFTLYTTYFHTSHFAHSTSHFTLDSLYSTQPGGLREAIK